MKHLKVVLSLLAFICFIIIETKAETYSIFGQQQEEIFGDTSPENKDYAKENEPGNGILSRQIRNADPPNRPRRDNKALIIDNYNSDEPPPVINGVGTPVRFNVLVFSVRGINEILQEINVDMRLQLSWKDNRIDWKSHVTNGSKYMGISLKKMQEMWFPDIFVDYVKAVNQPKLMSPPASLRYYIKDDLFRYSTRITLKMDCPMQFRYYPADLQVCKIDMKSYAFTDDIVQLGWKEEKAPLMLLEKGLDAPNFALSLAKNETFVIHTNSGHNYTGIRFRVQLQRQLSYHMMQTYIPSSLFVFVSMLSFLVPPESVPGRMAICMTTLLTLTAMWSAVRSNIPKVSYIKALDIWMVACVFFVCLALLQYTVLLNLRSRKPKPKPEDSERKPSTVSTISAPITGGGYPYNAVTPAPGMIRKSNDKPNDVPSTNDAKRESVQLPEANKIERQIKFLEAYTWIFVAVLFVVFNLIYWPWLLISSGYFVSLNDTVYYQ